MSVSSLSMVAFAIALSPELDAVAVPRAAPGVGWSACDPAPGATARAGTVGSSRGR